MQKYKDHCDRHSGSTSPTTYYSYDGSCLNDQTVNIPYVIPAHQRRKKTHGTNTLARETVDLLWMTLNKVCDEHPAAHSMHRI